MIGRRARPVVTGLRFATSIGGDPVVFPLGQGHALVAGRTGSGKSTVLRSLLWSAASDPDVSIVAVDLKLVELSGWLPRLAYLATTRVRAVRALTTIRNVIDARYAAMQDSGQVEWTTLMGPWLIVVVDELAELLTGPKSAKPEVEEAEALLDSISRLGRAAGIVLILATQRPAVEVLGGSLRDQLGWRFAMAVSDRGTSALITQGAAVDCTTLTDLAAAGWGYWLSPNGPPVLARGDFRPVALVTAHARATAHLRRIP